MPSAILDQPFHRSIVTDEYRRTARRLRARHARDLTTLHRSLEEAAREFDARMSSPKRIEPPQAAFERVVATRVCEPVVRYSFRIELIREAQRMGVGRFDANLIIATRQHRVAEQPPKRSVDEPRFVPQCKHGRGRILAACVVVTLVQGLIVWAATHVLM